MWKTQLTFVSDDWGAAGVRSMFSWNVSRTPRRSMRVESRRLSSSGTVTSPRTMSLENRSNIGGRLSQVFFESRNDARTVVIVRKKSS